jgi:hypothetical protein
MNCIPVTLAALAVTETKTVAEVVLAVITLVGLLHLRLELIKEEFADGAGQVKPSATAAVSSGSMSPKPHPPSRSCAMTGPAHFPVLKPQQLSAQSASDVQGPVMN